MSLVLLFHYLLFNTFRMLVHPSSGACDLLWIYFMYCIVLVRCVLVLRCGVVSLCIALQHMKQIHNKSQAPEDGCTNIRNMLSSKQWNNKTSDIELVYLYSTSLNLFDSLIRTFWLLQTRLRLKKQITVYKAKLSQRKYGLQNFRTNCRA
jgi:hypothetical protein